MASYQYASNTTVSVAKTRAEIEEIVMRYGGKSFGSMIEEAAAMILFDMKTRRIRFTLPLPPKDNKKYSYTPTGKYRSRTPEERYALWEQDCRQKWRALLLSIKAKLESVSAGISTFEEEFLANIVQHDGHTIGESMMPMLDQVVANSTASRVLLLPAPQQSGGLNP